MVRTYNEWTIEAFTRGAKINPRNTMIPIEFRRKYLNRKKKKL